MKTIYISGKIDGLGYSEASKNFLIGWRKVARRFFEERDGVRRLPKIINPMDIHDIPNGSWFDYIMRDLIYLKHCDTIYMLKDWKDSPGARVEHEFAKKLGLEIIYEEEKEEESNGNG